MAITTSLSPNVQADDLFIALKTLFWPVRWHRYTILAKITRLLSARLANRPTVLVSSGRSAIYRTLEALGIGPGDEVIVQAFTCLAVPAPVIWRHATPVFADINLSTYNFNPLDVAAKITPRTKAIIIQHTFGIAGPLKELRQLADKHQITLIEDLSHSLGANLKNQPLGIFGHVAILSFGRDKTISCVFGGAIASANQAFIRTVEKNQTSLRLPPSWWIVQQLLHPLLMSFIIPLYFVGSLGKAYLVLAQKLRILSLAVTKEEKSGGRPAFLEWRFSPALGFLLLNQLRKLDKYTARRQSIARRYFASLPLAKQLAPPNRPNWLRVPLRVKNRTALLAYAKQHHISLGNWYDRPVTPVSSQQPTVAGYQECSCPQAELAAATTINLPTHPNLTDEQVDAVIAVMSKARWTRL